MQRRDSPRAAFWVVGQGQQPGVQSPVAIASPASGEALQAERTVGQGFAQGGRQNFVLASLACSEFKYQLLEHHPPFWFWRPCQLPYDCIGWNSEGFHH